MTLQVLHPSKEPLAVSLWRDPEYWAQFQGLGCSLCQVRPPIIFGLHFGLRFGALCDVCLERCLPGWNWERIAGWLVRQKVALLRQTERRQVLKTWRPWNLAPALAYEKKYGVWLLDWPHP